MGTSDPDDPVASRDAEKAHDRLNGKTEKLMNAAIASGDLALRTSVTINGGAAVAILAFIGALVARDEIAAEHLVRMASTLVVFAFGAGMAVVGMALAYFTNSSAAEALYRHRMIWQRPYVEQTDAARKWGRGSSWLQGFAVIAGLASLALFLWGMVSVSNAAIEIANAIQRTG